MASDIPRERIDQFFASKKRKAVSTGLKSGRSEKNAKVASEGSPGSNDTLDEVLVNNQHKASAKDHESSPQNERVKRNLTAEINLSSDIDYGSTQDNILVGDKLMAPVRDTAIDDLVKDSATSAQGTENVELKTFATQFLSLCCSALPSASSLVLNAHKRLGSPRMQREQGKMLKNSPQIGDKSQSSMHEAPTSRERSLENIEFKNVMHQTPGGPEASNKTHPVELHGGLRKCNQLSDFTGDVTADRTPGPVTVKPCAVETPKSWRGSSFSSPGEEFWREAIAVADGLIVPNDISSGQNHTSQDVDKGNLILESTYASRNKNLDKMLEEHLDKCESKVQIETMASSHLTVKQAKSSDKYVSALPVKHFDFSSEGKNLSRSTMHHISAESTQGMTRGCYEKPESASGEFRGDITSNIVSHGTASKANHHIMTATGDAIELKEGASYPSNGVSAHNYHDKENRNLSKNRMPDMGSTPSSCKSLQDHLDLSQWLPQEICSIYKKKGISQLYPWQVECLQVEGVLERRNLVYCASTRFVNCS
uniref:Uncharacterized protein n=1 Tax=Kalanchoe fedtschenkoi TaxID=63787 RepID=A0A7N0VKR9_KALFE